MFPDSVGNQESVSKRASDRGLPQLVVFLCILAAGGCSTKEHGDTLEDGLKLLKSEDEVYRGFAAEFLAKSSNREALGALIGALNDPKWNVRRKAAEGLGVLMDVRAIKPLIASAREGNARMRDCAFAALTRFGEVVVPEAVPLLKDENPFIRGRAVKMLSQIGGKRVVEEIVACLKEDPDPYVRASAAEGLGRLGDPTVVDALKEALGDGDECVRAAARKGISSVPGMPTTATTVPVTPPGCK